MNHYEAAFLLNPNLGEKEIDQFGGEAQELLRKHGATDVGEARVERRSLAYPVKKQTEGFYVFVEFTGPATIPAQMRTELRHREDLFRFAFVNKPEPTPPAEPAAARPEETGKPAATAETPEVAPKETAPTETAPAEPAPAEVAPAEEDAAPAEAPAAETPPEKPAEPEKDDG